MKSGAAWSKVRAIAGREARLYLRSPSFWLSIVAVVALTLWSVSGLPRRSLELFLASVEALTVLLSAFVVTLLVSAGWAREEREAFSDVWLSLPARNAQQFWGKTLGAGAAAFVFALGLFLLVPVGWRQAGTVWTESTSAAVLAYTAQTVGILMLSVGIAALLRGAVANLRLRYVLGLLAVVALELAQALGIDNRALWAVLLSPYTLGSLPYAQSSLFGLWPWEPAVLWHVVFQCCAAALLIVAGRLAYERRRDPAQRKIAAWAAAAFLAVGAAASAGMYVRYWGAVEANIDAQVLHDAIPGPQIADGGVTAAPHESAFAPTVRAYDLTVTLADGGRTRIVAALALGGEPAGEPWPFTLHRQWEVRAVHGEAVRGWRREGNLVWVEFTPGTASERIVFEYEGEPLLWNWEIGVIYPMHFMGEHGGYLAPYHAWYPLPGRRSLASVVYEMSGRRRWVLPARDRLLPQPVPFRLTWDGPEHFEAVTNLPLIERTASGGRLRAVFAGRSDGAALLAGRLIRIEAPGMTLVGAPGAVHGADALAPAYNQLISFYEDLVGRTLPRGPVVVIPGWLGRLFPYAFRVAASAADGLPGMMRVLAHMGAHPVVTEQALAEAVAAAERWQRTQAPEDLLAATAAVNYGVLHAVWGRPHTFRPITEHDRAVARGLAEYMLLRWSEHVLGAAFDPDLRARARAGTAVARMNEADRAVQRVLTALLEHEERYGDAAVRALLGALFDRMEAEAVDLAVFEAMLADAAAFGAGRGSA